MLLGAVATITVSAQQGKWVVVDSIAGNKNIQIACADSLHCMALSMYGFAYASIVRATTDGGTTWKNVHQDNDTPLLDALNHNAIAYPTPGVCLIACDSGIVLRTRDTGRTWERLHPGTTDNFFALTMRDANNGVMMTFPRAIWRTTNGGDSWDSVRIPFEISISIKFVFQLTRSTLLATLIYANRDSATMISNDNGKTWKRYPYPTNSRSIIFLDSLTGWSCGSKAIGQGFYKNFVTHTTDGGKSWNVQLDSMIGEPFGLSDIAFADRNNGVAVGTGAKMLRTSDGGATWKFEETGLEQQRVESTFSGIAYPTRTRAFAVTTFGGIYRYVGEPPSSAVVEDGAAGSVVGLRVRAYPTILCSHQEVELLLELARAGSCSIGLINAVGEVVQAWPLQAVVPGAQRHQLRLGDCPSGAYFLRVVCGGEAQLMPIVVR